MNIKELIDQIGGRARLEALIDDEDCRVTVAEQELLAMIALAVLDAKPTYYIHRVEARDSYGPEVDLRVFIYELDASKCKDDHGGEVIEVFTTPPAASAPDGLSAAVNLLLDSDGSRGTFSAIRRGNALAKVERLLASAPALGVDGG